MDIIVTNGADTDCWEMTDLLGRPMGKIEESFGTFTLKPQGKAIDTMADMAKKEFLSLDAALAAVETHTRGTCRLAPATTAPE